MSQPDPPSFHLRLPPTLKAQLQASRGRNSLNREIIERLERTFEPDPALRFAEILRPMLAALDDDDQEKLITLAAHAVEILAKGSARRRK